MPPTVRTPAQPSPMIAEMLAAMPAATRASFTDEQIAALSQAPLPRAQHIVDYKASVPMLPGRRFYVRLLIGNERRNLERLAREGQRAPARLAMVYGTAVMLALGLCMAAALLALPLLEATTGMALAEGGSPIEQLFILMLQR